MNPKWALAAFAPLSRTQKRLVLVADFVKQFVDLVLCADKSSRRMVFLAIVK